MGHWCLKPRAVRGSLRLSNTIGAARLRELPRGPNAPRGNRQRRQPKRCERLHIFVCCFLQRTESVQILKFAFYASWSLGELLFLPQCQTVQLMPFCIPQKESAYKADALSD